MANDIVLAFWLQTSQADEVLSAFCAAQPQTLLLPALMRAQLALEAGNNPGQALQVLASIPYPGVQVSPAMVVTRVTLHEHVGDVAGAESLLQQVRSCLQKRQTSRSSARFYIKGPTRD